MRTLILPMLLLVVLTACDETVVGPGQPVDRQMTVGVGETATVSEVGISIRFEGVTGDSRCPIDAVCIQGGDAIVHLDVLPARAGTSEYELHTGNMKPVTHGDVTIALVDLTPYPFSSRPIQQNEYRATLRVTR
jgi:hypothetical protein